MRRNILVFDFFGVICSEIAPFWLQRYFSADQAVAIKRELVTQADTGEISQQDLFSKLGALAKVEAETVHQEWWSFVKIDADVIDVIHSLPTSYRIALLTNSPSPFVRGILSKYRLESLFEILIVSSEEGLAKPNPKIYHRILGALQSSPSAAVMIDDNPHNVAGAEAIGMQGLLFQTADVLRKQISELA